MKSDRAKTEHARMWTEVVRAVKRAPQEEEVLLPTFAHFILSGEVESIESCAPQELSSSPLECARSRLHTFQGSPAEVRLASTSRSRRPSAANALRPGLR